MKVLSKAYSSRMFTKKRLERSHTGRMRSLSGRPLLRPAGRQIS